MKKLLFLVMLLITITSCKKSDVTEIIPVRTYQPPIIDVFSTNNNTMLLNYNQYNANGTTINDTASFEYVYFNILSEAGIEEIKIIQSDKNNFVDTLNFSSVIINQSQNYLNQINWRATFTVENIKTYLAPYKISITVIDNKNQVTTNQLIINFKF